MLLASFKANRLNKNEIVIESLDLFHASPLCSSKRFIFSKLFLVQQVKIGYKLFFSHKNLKLFEAYIYLNVFNKNIYLGIKI